MKKNLLAALVVFFFTFVVLLVVNDISNNKNPQIDSHYMAADE